MLGRRQTPRPLPCGPVQTRYLIVAALATALAILAASVVWFLMRLA